MAVIARDALPAYWQPAELLAERAHGTAKPRFRGPEFHWPFTCLVSSATNMKAQALQYYMHDVPIAFRFELAGHLDHEGARRLEQDWRTASSTLGDRRRIIDMTFVTGVDEQGHALITRWHLEGAWFVANSKASRALTEAILGEPLQLLPYAGDPIVSDRTWTPFGALFRVPVLVLLTAMALPIEANAATSADAPTNAGQVYSAPAALLGRGFAFTAAYGVDTVASCVS